MGCGQTHSRETGWTPSSDDLVASFYPLYQCGSWRPESVWPIVMEPGTALRVAGKSAAHGRSSHRNMEAEITCELKGGVVPSVAPSCCSAPGQQKGEVTEGRTEFTGCRPHCRCALTWIILALHHWFFFFSGQKNERPVSYWKTKQTTNQKTSHN